MAKRVKASESEKEQHLYIARTHHELVAPAANLDRAELRVVERLPICVVGTCG